jgi:peptidoglycan/LPS O-acetylase OafA/YrhL
MLVVELPLHSWPNVGVLIFFILSGFLIAHTLATKSESESYSLAAFGIERFSRIYTAYLPAIILIAAADYVMQYFNNPLPGDPTNLKTLLGNLTMRQGLPSNWGVSTFGSAGHLTSVAVEFHIYFFVGAIFFLLRGRGTPLICLVVAVFFYRMPLGYFSSIPNSDRSLFAMWLAGFAAYFIAKSIRLHPKQAAFATVAFVGLIWYWATHRSPNDYDLSNYPALALAFLALVIATQNVRLVRDEVARVVRFVADYSFSLFLVHLTVVKLISKLPIQTELKIAMAILFANVAAVLLLFPLNATTGRWLKY